MFKVPKSKKINFYPITPRSKNTNPSKNRQQILISRYLRGLQKNIFVPPIFDKIQRFESLVNLEVVVSPVFDGYFALGLPVLDYTGL